MGRDVPGSDIKSKIKHADHSNNSILDHSDWVSSDDMETDDPLWQPEKGGAERRRRRGGGGVDNEDLL